MDLFGVPPAGVPACVLTKTASQTTATGVYTIMTWEKAIFNIGGMWDPSYNTRIFIPQSGVYTMTCGLGFITQGGTTLGGQMGMRIGVNGRTALDTGPGYIDPGSGFFNPVSSIVFNQWLFAPQTLKLSAGDFFEVQSYQNVNSPNPGTNIDVYGDAVQNSFVSCIRAFLVSRTP